MICTNTDHYVNMYYVNTKYVNINHVNKKSILCQL